VFISVHPWLNCVFRFNAKARRGKGAEADLECGGKRSATPLSDQTSNFATRQGHPSAGKRSATPLSD
jgi:hypothetical protein